ncbi:hypothetical protein [Shinella sp.]|nr:hypothetical protein [Shinella sp.]
MFAEEGNGRNRPLIQLLIEGMMKFHLSPDGKACGGDKSGSERFC